MLIYLLKGLGISLALTLVLETAFAFVLGVRGKSLIPVILVNLLTNPIVVFLSLTLVEAWCGRIILEVIVFAVEGLIYLLFDGREGYSIRNPFLKSLMLNAFSYGIGGIIEGCINSFL